jgi:HEAT repeat protein
VCLLERAECATCKTDLSSELAEAIPTVGRGLPSSALDGSKILIGCILPAIVFAIVATVSMLVSLDVTGPSSRAVGKEEQGVTEQHLALERLRSKGKAAEPALIEALGNEDAGVRARAARLLAANENGTEAAIPALVKALADVDVDVRTQGLTALATYDTQAKPAIPALVRLLRDEHPHLRMGAATVLSLLRAEGALAIPALTAALRDDNFNVRQQALRALIKIGPAAAEALAQALSSDDAGIRLTAEEALVALGPDAEAAVPIVAALAKPRATSASRKTALRILSAIGSEAALPTLVAALSDKSQTIQLLALAALKRLGPAASPAIDDLLANLSGSASTRRYVIQALADIGDAALPALVRVARNPTLKLDVRRTAIQRLAEQKSPAATRALAEGIRDPDKGVRSACSAALMRQTARLKPAMPVLLETLADANADARSKAAWVLSRVGSSAIPALLHTLAQTPQSAHGVTLTLSQLSSASLAGSKETVAPALVRVLKGEDDAARKIAFRALQKMGTSIKLVLPDLVPLLASPHPLIQRAALGLIRGLKGAATRDLMDGLKHPNPKVRVSCAKALGHLGRDGLWARSALTLATKDTSAQVRAAAATALQRLGGRRPGAKITINER